MSDELVSIIVLALIFVIATFIPINIGALAFVAAFGLGWALLGYREDEILEGFPAGLAVTLIGITYLFAIAQNNGTIDWLVALAVKAVRGRLVAIPWIMFVIAGVLTAFGAVSPAAVAIIAPVALGFAYRYRINPLLMGLMVIHGAQAGGFSPISIYGSITNGIVEDADLESSPLTLMLTSIVFNLAIALIAFFLLGGPRLLRRKAGDDLPEDTAPDGTAGSGTDDDGASSVAVGSGGGEHRRGLHPHADQSGQTVATVDRPGAASPDADPTTDATATPYRIATLVGLVALAVGALLLDLDVGLTALSVAVVLALISPHTQKKAVSQVSWPTVLLITGVLTYVAVLQELGTIDYVSDAIGRVGSALLAALLLFYLGAVVSAFASSTALLGALIPLAVPFLAGGEVGAVGVVAALAVSSTVVDVSPFSTNGALVLANAEEEGKDAFYKRLLTVGVLVVLIAPVVAWLVLVAPGWL